MKTLKRLTKALITGYINGFRESANMTYGYLYRK